MEKQQGMEITFQNLRISPYEARHLLEVKMVQQMNEHGTLYVKALLPEAPKNSYVDWCAGDNRIRLTCLLEDGSEAVLFQGLVRDIQVENAGETYYMEVRAFSCSCLLDIEKRTRTFQQKDMSYEMLMEQVSAGYEMAGVADFTSQGASIE